MENTEDNKLKNPLNLVKLPLNKDVTITLTHENPWVQELLVELHEGVTGMPVRELVKRSTFDVELNLCKKFQNTIGEYLLAKITIDIQYFTNCIKTLALMKDSLNLTFQSAVLPKTLEENEEYTDQVEVFLDNEMYDLYFYEKNFVDIKEIIHEQIYLNKNEYPVRDEVKAPKTDTADQEE